MAALAANDPLLDTKNDQSVGGRGRGTRRRSDGISGSREPPGNSEKRVQGLPRFGPCSDVAPYDRLHQPEPRSHRYRHEARTSPGSGFATSCPSTEHWPHAAAARSRETGRSRCPMDELRGVSARSSLDRLFNFGLDSRYDLECVRTGGHLANRLTSRNRSPSR